MPGTPLFVKRDTRDEAQRNPRAQKEDRLWRIISATGKKGMTRREAMGALSTIWPGMSSRAFNDYIEMLAARGCIDFKGNDLWSVKEPEKWPEKEVD